MSNESKNAGISTSGSSDRPLLATQCVVTTFAGSGEEESCDGIGAAAGVPDPIAMCFSKSTNSLVFHSYGGQVRRVHLSATPEMRTALADSAAAGVERMAPALAAIRPLIDLIVSYALNDGTTTANSSPNRQGRACTELLVFNRCSGNDRWCRTRKWRQSIRDERCSIRRV